MWHSIALNSRKLTVPSAAAALAVPLSGSAECRQYQQSEGRELDSEKKKIEKMESKQYQNKLHARKACRCGHRSFYSTAPSMSWSRAEEGIYEARVAKHAFEEFAVQFDVVPNDNSKKPLITKPKNGSTAIDGKN